MQKNDTKIEKSANSIRNDRIYFKFFRNNVINKLHVLYRAFIFFIALPTLVFALGIEIMPTALAATGNTLFNSSGAATTLYGFDNGTQYYLGYMYQPATNQYVCSITTNLRKTGSPTGYLTAYLYENEATVNPLSNYTEGELLGTNVSSTTVNIATMSAFATDITFEFDSCAGLLTGETYFFKFLTSVQGTAGNRIDATGYTADSTDSNTYLWYNTGSWSAYGDRAKFTVKGYQSSLQVTGSFTDIASTSLHIDIAGLNLGSSTRSYANCGDDSVASTTLAKWGCYISTGIEKGIDYLFIPTNDSWGVIAVNNALEMYENIFPLSVIFTGIDTINSIAEGYEQGTESISYTAPEPWDYTLTITSSTIPNTIGSTSWNFIQTSISIMLWVGLFTAIITFF